MTFYLPHPQPFFDGLGGANGRGWGGFGADLGRGDGDGDVTISSTGFPLMKRLIITFSPSSLDFSFVIVPMFLAYFLLILLFPLC